MAKPGYVQQAGKPSPALAPPHALLIKQALVQARKAAAITALSGDRSALQRRAAVLMSRVDPKAAVEMCPGITGNSDAVEALSAAAAAIAPSDRAKANTLMATATGLLKNIPNKPQRVVETAQLCKKLATFDLEGALRLAREAAEPEVFLAVWTEAARSYPREMAKKLDPKGAPSAQRDVQIAALLPYLAAQDLPQTLALANLISDNLVKSQALSKAAFSLSPTDALFLARRIPDDFLRGQAIRAAAERLALTSPMEALRAINDPAVEHDSALSAIALNAMTVDWPQALALIGQIKSLRCRQDAVGLFIIALADKDAAAACKLADNPPQSAAEPVLPAEIPSWALPALCAAQTKNDYPGALARAKAISDDRVRETALVEIARAVAESSPQNAEDILAEIEQVELRFPALRALVTAIAKTDPERAKELTGLAANVRQVHLLLLDIAFEIARGDVSAAVKLAQSCPPSQEKTETLLQIALVDHKQGLGIAKLVLSEAAAGQAIVDRLAQQNPALAMQYANDIKDPLRRATAYCDIAEMLLQDNGAPAAPQILTRPEIQRVIEPGGPAAQMKAESGGKSPLEILAAKPEQLAAHIKDADAAALYTVRYQSPTATFTWENLQPDSDGKILLRDDGHLQPQQRLLCRSRGTETDLAFFDDFTKAEMSGKRRLQYGVPVSTFGGAGNLSSAPTWLHHDRAGNFWLYQEVRPWRIAAFDADFNYRFTLVFPARVLAMDSDSQANLYVLQEDNYLSRFDANGRPGAHWKLPAGRRPGGFVGASGLAISPDGNFLYLADEKLSRVQRYDLQLHPAPFSFTPWGWMGREDCGYTEFGSYGPGSTYRLDRPQRLLIGPDNLLYVDCAYYLSRFDLNSGKQMPFGKDEALGWGATFTDSPHIASAAANAHWQEHRLAGIDPQGTIYISDKSNSFLNNLRIQTFAPDGTFLNKYDLDTEIRDALGSRVYLVPPRGMVFSPAFWLADGGCRIYEGEGLTSGGKLHLGPGAPGRQFDLTGAEVDKFAVEKQAARIPRKVDGLIYSFNEGRHGTRNCEAERNATLPNNAASIWIPVKLGEPFRVSLTEEGREIPAGDYTIEIESRPGPFGAPYDYFRVTNKSGHVWKGVRYSAETLPATGP